MDDVKRACRRLPARAIFLLMIMLAATPAIATDLGVGAVHDPDTTLFYGDSTRFRFVIENTNRLDASDYSIDIQIRNAAGSTVYSDELPPVAIPAYSDQMITSTRWWCPSGVGVYRVTITIMFADDIDNSNNAKTVAVNVTAPACTEPRPIGAPGSTLVPYSGTEATISYTTEEPCCWVLQASAGNEGTSEIGVSPSTTVTLEKGSPVTFRFTPTRHDRPYMVKVQWRRCDETHVRVDYYVLHNASQAQEPVTGGSAPNSGTTLDPVNTATGELFMGSVDDLSLNGPMPLAFTRYYASALTRAGADVPLGVNWSHGHQWRLFRTATRALVLSDRGRAVTFAKIGAAWELEPRAETRYRLADDAGAFSFFDPRSRLVRTFDSSGLLRAVGDIWGNVQTLAYTPAGLLERIEDGRGGAITVAHDTARRITSVSDGARTVRYTYAGGMLASVTDVRGGIHRYDYAAGPVPGLMTAHTLPAGNAPYTQEFDAAGRVARQTDALGNVHSFEYAGLTTTVIDPLGNRRVHVHDTKGSLLEHRDESGRSIRFSYDDSGRRTRVVDRDGDTTLLSYDDASGYVASVRDPDGAVTTYSYAPRSVRGSDAHVLSRITYPDGAAGTYSHDASGRLTEHVDRAGKRWRYTYGARGELLAEVTPTGATTAYTHDASGLVATVRDPAGNVTTYTHDALRRPSTIAYADGSTHRYTYDARGNVLTATDPLGGTSTYTYDANERVVSIASPLGGTARYTYDAMNRIARQEHPGGGAWLSEYDSLGRVRALVDAAGNRVEYRYDAAGHLVASIDGEGNRWSSEHSGEGELTARTTPRGATRTFERDAMGRVTKTAVNGGAQGLAIEYDVLGRATTIEDAAGNETITAYGPRSAPTTITIAPGIAAAYTYDDRGTLTGATDANGGRWTSSYDAAGRLVGRGDPEGNAFNYTYDRRNRIDTVRVPGGGTIAFRYDAAGNVVGRNHSDGLVLSYSYDGGGRLVGAGGVALGYDAANGMTSSNGITIERDPLGRIAAMTLAPDRRIAYAYDRRSLVTSVTDWRGRTTTFGYDADGNLTRIDRPNGTASTIDYDSAGQIRTINEGDRSSIALARDATGRVTSAVRTVPLRATAAAVDLAMTYDDASQLTSATHDARGRMLRQGLREYAWDMATRLASYTDAGVAHTMTYDALGNRLSRTSGDTVTSYVWNYALGLPSISVLRTDDVDTWYYIHMPDGRLLYAADATGDERHYHYDELGSTLYLTDATGAITDSYAYTPYGAVARRVGSTPNPFTYIGMRGVVEEGTGGLYLMRHRYYDATIGRFLSRDPLGAVGPRSINPYQYAYDNPLRFVDVTGRDPEGPTAEEVNRALWETFGVGLPTEVAGDGTPADAPVDASDETTGGTAPTAEEAAPDAEMTDAEFREQCRRDMERWKADQERWAQNDRDRAEDQRRFNKAMQQHGDLIDEMLPAPPPLHSTPRLPAPPTPPGNPAPQTPPPPPPATSPKPTTPPPPVNPQPVPTAPPGGTPVAGPPGSGTYSLRHWMAKDIIDVLEYFFIVD